MDIGLLIKVAGVGILVAVTYVILSKSGRDEMAMLLSLCGIVIILILLVSRISELITSVKNAFGL